MGADGEMETSGAFRFTRHPGNLGAMGFFLLWPRMTVNRATEIGIEPSVSHAGDLGYVPVIIEDACGAGDEEAGRSSLELLRFAGDAMFADAATLEGLLSWTRASS